MSVYSRYYTPALKKTVDLQLQNAFSEGHWAAVIRLADKRAKSLKDPYYEAIKICAESQLDGPNEKCAVLFAVDELVRKGTVVPDLDTIELYDWACQGLQADLDYAETLGILRLRWVKANPRNSAGVMQCLQSCLQHWDLVNSQQIAALLEKSTSNTSDRRLRFWSIALTFLLSISPQCPDDKRKLYALLSLKQLERAADLTETSEKDDPTNRGLRTEEELYLYYRVLATHGSRDDFVKKMHSPQLGALKQFGEGRKHLFLEALDAFETWGNWDAIYDFCLRALSRRDEDGTPSFLASDWRVWKRFIMSASKSSDDRRAFEQVQSLLDTFISTKAKVAQMYKKTIALAVLETTFRLPQTLLPRDSGVDKGMPRVVQICLFLDKNYDRLSAFDDVKGYVSSLTFQEVDYFLSDMLPKLAGDETHTAKSVSIRVLELKFRYLLTTCPQTLSRLPSVVDGEAQSAPYRCRVCSNPASQPCITCLTKVAMAAASLRHDICADADFIKCIPSLDKDPRSDLSLILAMCLLKMSGLDGSQSLLHSGTPLHSVNPARFLQAVLVLDTQLKETPHDPPLRLLLVQLYLLLGCGLYAYQLWAPLDVTRTIQDSLSPLFFDRIFSLAPGLFQGSRPLMEPLRSYYFSTLKDKSPVRIWDAFSSGSYSSILDMAEYDSRLRRSCTLMMTVVEERRATRAFGGRMDDVDELPLIADINDATDLVDVTDYGSFPSLESLYSAPPQDLVRLGPGLSNERGHLSHLSERFLDLINFKPPKDYKPTRPSTTSSLDKTYLTETLAQLHNSFAHFLHLPSITSKLTGPEETYFTVLNLLSSTLLTALTTPPTGATLPATLPVLTSAVKAALQSLRAGLAAMPASGTGRSAWPTRGPEILSGLVSMHGTSTARETAVAVRRSVALMVGLHESAGASGSLKLHKDVLVELKALDSAAGKVLGDVKARIGMLRDALGEAGWLDRVIDWTFGEEEGDEVTGAVSLVIGARGGAEDWASKVIESWREGVKGWGNVRME